MADVDGYARIAVGRAEGRCLTALASGLTDVLRGSTLHAWAARQPDRRALQGRDTAYAVTLPDGATRAVVRHGRHGGLLAPLTRDVFLAPTRAPRELATSLALRAAGVRTPEVVAWVTYRAGPLLRRADVATRLVEGGRDLAAAVAARDVDWVTPTRVLLDALAAAAVRHPDLNLKNVLLDAAGDAWVLDVDVVSLGASPSDARSANAARLERSLLKWQRLHALPVDDASIRRLFDRQ